MVLFFDEINTNDNVSGILKEIVIDRKIIGEELGEEIVPIAACNPYKYKGFYKTDTLGIDAKEIEGTILLYHYYNYY